jgi:hypothetical protein
VAFGLLVIQQAYSLTQWMLGFLHGLCVKSEGRSGGIALWWKREISVSLKSLAEAHIDVFISPEESGWKEFRLTGFYGEPRRVSVLKAGTC